MKSDDAVLTFAILRDDLILDHLIQKDAFRKKRWTILTEHPLYELPEGDIFNRLTFLCLQLNNDKLK